MGGVLASLSGESNRLRFARTLRRTFDQIYDGRNTGRYRWDQLRKTGKTHFGSIVEINLQREFSFDDGLTLDYRITGDDVDCKWSQSPGGWMLPPEAIGHICLLVTGSDEQSTWAGLVRADVDVLNLGSNRDAKKTLNGMRRAAIQWIWHKAVLPENLLLHIDPAVVKGIMEDLHGVRLGQRRLNELFRRFTNRPIGRGVIATVAQQDDYMKRVRANGGSRGHLKPEGIVIFVIVDISGPTSSRGQHDQVNISRNLRGSRGPGDRVGTSRFQHQALVEIDKHCCTTLRFNRPKWNVIHEDVRDFDGSPYRNVDLFAGGVPCPPFSVAGKQLGEADERNLFPSAIRLISEIRPKAVLLENVKGLKESAFDDYRRAISDSVNRLGYLTHRRLLNASDYGVPQLRPACCLLQYEKMSRKASVGPNRNSSSLRLLAMFCMT